MSFFNQAFEIVVGIEGGYVNDPKDPGGESRFGISKRAYPNLDIANLTLEQAKALYFEDYWTPAGCETMPWERALCVFDMAVNQGVGVARSVNVQAHDAAELMAERAVRYAENPNFTHFGRGWMRRLFAVFKNAQRSPS